jgi:hypothetical protein
MFTIGMSIGVSFVISLVAGPLLAAAIGVSGVFLLIGGLGLVALALVLFVLPAEQPLRRQAGARNFSQVLTRKLLPHYAGIFMLHLTLTATFIAVPHVLRDLHGLDSSRHWLVYLGVFAASIVSDRATRRLVGAQPPGSRGIRRRCGARRSAGGLVWAQPAFDALLAALGALFRCLQFPGSAIAGRADRGRRRGVARSGPRRLRNLPVRRCVCRQPDGRGPARKSLERHGNFRLCGGGCRHLAALGRGIRIAAIRADWRWARGRRTTTMRPSEQAGNGHGTRRQQVI